MEPPRTSDALQRILALARPEAPTLIIASIFLLIGSGLGLASPKLIGALIDGINAGEGTGGINQTVGVLMLVFVGMGIATSLRSYLFTVSGERVVTWLRRDLFRSLIRQEIGFFDAQRTGELTNRLAADTTVLQNAVTVNVSMALRFVVTVIGAVIILAWSNWKLTLVMLAIVPIVALGGGFYGRALRKVSRKAQDSLAAATAVAEEGLAGVRTVRAFAREEQESLRYGAAVQEAFLIAKTRARLYGGFTGLMTFAGYGAIGGVLWYGGRLVAAGEMSFGDLTSFLLYTFTLAFGISALSGLWGDFAKAIGASERVFELLDRVPTVGGGTQQLATVGGHVRMEGVVFRYPTRDDVTVLDGMDLQLEPGRVVALVGPSGGGKSTVAALLSRFYDPNEGRLLLDGVPYTELDPNWLREQVGVVSQEPLLFASSILENIRYGRPGASKAEVEAAAQAANAHDFISSFPQGYDTLVGERGVRLSGGQKQRVAIARAVLKDPRVLILDEATSALDAESEHLVQEALDRLMTGRTTLVIAHRLSTVRDADRVLVIDGGRVAQEGLYRKLVERQFAAA